MGRARPRPRHPLFPRRPCRDPAKAAAMNPRVTIRPVVKKDGPALVAAHIASRAFHHPWAEPFTDQPGFEAWFAQTRTPRKVALLVECESRLVGLVNLNEIV